jgi:hypothetical protein
MAFTFPRRNPELLYFPTLHVHDRKVHPHAMFDHMLYCQPDASMPEYLLRWERSLGRASSFIDMSRSEGIVGADQHCWRLPLNGLLINRDTLVGQGGMLPEFA